MTNERNFPITTNEPENRQAAPAQQRGRRTRLKLLLLGLSLIPLLARQAGLDVRPWLAAAGLGLLASGAAAWMRSRRLRYNWPRNWGLRLLLVTMMALDLVLLGPGRELAYASLNHAGGGGIAYTFNDHQGSVIALTENGAVTRRNHYDPWGRTRHIDYADEETEQKGVWSTLGWTGERVGTADGLVWLRARHYNPYLGRFMQQDGLETGNPYAFLPNPVNNIDPTGNIAWAPLLGWVAKTALWTAAGYAAHEAVLTPSAHTPTLHPYDRKRKERYDRQVNRWNTALGVLAMASLLFTGGMALGNNPRINLFVTAKAQQLKMWWLWRLPKQRPSIRRGEILLGRVRRLPRKLNTAFLSDDLHLKFAGRLYFPQTKRNFYDVWIHGPEISRFTRAPYAFAHKVRGLHIERLPSVSFPASQRSLFERMGIPRFAIYRTWGRRYYTPQELANTIRKLPGYKSGQPVRLNVCSAGASLGNTCLAQEVANELRVDVLGPTDVLWVHHHRRVMSLTIDRGGRYHLYKPQ